MYIYLWTLAFCFTFIHGSAYRMRSGIPGTRFTSRAERCKVNQFFCPGQGCLSEDLTCDGKVDCQEDSLDEKGCFYFPCPGYAFKCTYGACISPDLVCNGQQDCKDNSDENPYRCGGKNPENIYGNCSRLQFGCKSGECIDDLKLCDGRQDCNDASDESEVICSLLRCPEFAFRCDNGACINRDLVCDNTRNCFDGSDERNCVSIKQQKCSYKQFQCESGECIDDFDLCDGIKHCSDSSDETINVCRQIHCPLYAFQCKYGGCINAEKQCNGVQDCVDGTDEKDCVGQSQLNPKPTPFTPRKPITTVRPKDNQFDGLTTYTTPRIKMRTTEETQTPLPRDMSNLCQLPANITNGWYTVNRKKVFAYPHGDYVPKSTKFRFQCNNGYALQPPNATSVCTDEWSTLPQCLKTCAVIQLEHSRNVTCTFNDISISCSRPPPQGTRARMHCSQGYHDPTDPYAAAYGKAQPGRINLHDITCYEGSWDSPLLHCIPSAR